MTKIISLDHLYTIKNIVFGNGKKNGNDLIADPKRGPFYVLI